MFSCSFFGSLQFVNCSFVLHCPMSRPFLLPLARIFSQILHYSAFCTIASPRSPPWYLQPSADAPQEVTRAPRGRPPRPSIPRPISEDILRLNGSTWHQNITSIDSSFDLSVCNFFVIKNERKQLALSTPSSKKGIYKSVVLVNRPWFCRVFFVTGPDFLFLMMIIPGKGEVNRTTCAGIGGLRRTINQTGLRFEYKGCLIRCSWYRRCVLWVLLMDGELPVYHTLWNMIFHPLRAKRSCHDCRLGIK